MESSSKRARAPGNMTQIAHCLVDGCNADLSLCRDYHRRHKVCETHSKTSKVTIGGRELRFCQQCSRFHSLVEFDEGKRSCRKRLDGHNRRRRKPPQLDRNSGLDFSHHHSTTLTATGTTPTTSLVSFRSSTTNNNNSPQILPSAVVGFSWPGPNVKTENEMVLYNSMNFMDRPNDYKANNYMNNNNNNNHRHGQVVGPDGALSLLSSNQSTSATRELGFVQNEPLVLLSGQGLVQNYGGNLGQHYQNQEMKTVNDSSHGRTNASTLHFADMFQQGEEGSSASGPHQTLTFMWE
ncbi:hypothetical protein ACP275_11G073800 [Erythranthe tilingii]